MILKRILQETGWEGEDSINLAFYRDESQAFVCTVLNLRVTQNMGYFRPAQ